MKKIVVGFVMLLLVASSYGAWTPLNWDIKYDADVMPATSGAVKAWNGTAYVGATASNFGLNPATGNGVMSSGVSGGIFSASTLTSDKAGYWQRSLLTASFPTGTVMPDSSVGYAVELRMKVTSVENGQLGLFTIDEATGYVSSAAPGIIRTMTVGFNQVAVGSTYTAGSGQVLDAGMWVYLPGTNTQYVKIDAAGDFNFHTYRLLADNAGYSLYIDGSTTAAISNWAYSTSTSSNAFRLGDQSSTVDASYELDYIGIRSAATVIPEPATMLLLALGSCCFGLKKKRN